MIRDSKSYEKGLFLLRKIRDDSSSFPFIQFEFPIKKCMFLLPSQQLLRKRAVPAQKNQG
jgi:hypothetical protein